MAFVHTTPYEDGRTTPRVISAKCALALRTFMLSVAPDVAEELKQVFHDARIIHKNDLNMLLASPNLTAVVSPGQVSYSVPLNIPVMGQSVSMPAPAPAPAPKKKKTPSEKAEKAPKSAAEKAAKAAAKPQKILCRGFKKDGNPCTNSAQPGKQFCGVHEPK